ncbi:hypothetical protein KP509_01G022000 [Ceratopteris richardii]|uniref:Uncharacterized protein n=1 Tax=Ceratopteris richardii TaxID=49495 RepID=A0A8T2VF72_CERRI|nr:hypothetical protein KP509_01G022000 [Ceratopteris richardii]
MMKLLQRKQWLGDVLQRSLKQKEVCVCMLSAPINPSDVNRIEGVCPVGPPVPVCGGNEGIGELIEVSGGVKDPSVSGSVIPVRAGLGTRQNSRIEEETDWCKVRKDIPIEYAATSFINTCRTSGVLEDFVPSSEGDSRLWNGTSSIGGQTAIQSTHLNDLRTANIIRERPDFQEVKLRLEVLGASGLITDDEAASKETVVPQQGFSISFESAVKSDINQQLSSRCVPFPAFTNTAQFSRGVSRSSGFFPRSSTLSGSEINCRTNFVRGFQSANRVTGLFQGQTHCQLLEGKIWISYWWTTGQIPQYARFSTSIESSIKENKLKRRGESRRVMQ